MKTTFGFYTRWIVLSLICTSQAIAQCETETLTPTLEQARLNYGDVLTLDADLLAVGSPNDSSLGQNAGAVLIYRRDLVCWHEEATLTAPQEDLQVHFGRAVSLSGDILLVGAHAGSGDEGPVGAAYVFRRTLDHGAGHWVLEQRLPDPATGLRTADLFATTLAVSGDVAVVGARGTVVPTGSVDGAVYVYRNQGGTWFYSQAITPAGFNLARDAHFGHSLALSGDRIVIGSFDMSNVGEAYVFRDNGTTFDWEATLGPKDASSGETSFGYSVDIDGLSLVIGAPLMGVPTSTGAAYVFDFVSGAWLQQPRLLAPDGMQGDEFGGATFGQGVSIVGDRVAIGALQHSHSGVTSAGAAYVFERDAGGSFGPTVELRASDGAALDQLGSSVAMSREWVVAGAPQRDSRAGTSDVGAVYVFDVSALGLDLLAGNVDMRFGSAPATVFTVNGSAGGSSHEVAVAWGVDVELGIASAPSVTSGHYLVWIMSGVPQDCEATAIRLRTSGGTFCLGLGARSLPTNGAIAGDPCPALLMNGRATRRLSPRVAMQICVDEMAYAKSPTSFLVRFPVGDYVVGGLVQDSNAPAAPGKRVGIGNWVIVRSR